MQIDFDIAKRDFVAFSLYHRWYSPSRKHYRLRTKFMAGGFLFCLPYLFLYFSDERFTVPLVLNISIYATFAFFCGFLGAPNSIVSSLTKRSNKYLNHPENKNFDGQVSFNFGVNSIQFKTDASEGTMHYEAIKKLAETNNYFYLYVSSSQAFILPKLAFRNTQNLTDFVSLINNRTRLTWEKQVDL